MSTLGKGKSQLGNWFNLKELCVLTWARMSLKLWFPFFFPSILNAQIIVNLVQIAQILASNYDYIFFSNNMLFIRRVFWGCCLLSVKKRKLFVIVLYCECN